MPQVADWPPTRADAQHILHQHPDAPPQHIHTCKVCGDTYWGIKHPVSHRIRSFCSKRCYYKHNESSPAFQRYRTSPKGKAMRQKVSAKNAKSERGRLRYEQRQRWHKLVISLDPSQKPKTKKRQSRWATCSTSDCHNIPTKKRARSCSACLHDARVANLPNTWRNAGKPCVECSKPLQRYQGKFCSHTCRTRSLSRSQRKRNPEKYRNRKRLQQQRSDARKRAVKLEAAKNGEFLRICTHCDKQFDAYRPKGRIPNLCSKRCERQARDLRRRAVKRDAFVEIVSVKKLAKWQSWKCYHCGCKIDSSKKAPHPKSLTLDHLIPLSLGGPHSYANTVAACWNCNCTIKGTRAIGEQLKLV